MTSLLAKIRIA